MRLFQAGFGKNPRERIGLVAALLLVALVLPVKAEETDDLAYLEQELPAVDHPIFLETLEAHPE